MFRKASRKNAKLRMAIFGPSGAGKSYTSLRIGSHLAKLEGKPLAAIDTERGSLSKYAGTGEGEFQFDVIEPEEFGPEVFTRLIGEAAKAGYGVLVIDSLSHAWMGKGGALEKVDAASARTKGNSYVAWRDVTPLHNGMIDAILQSPLHIIATMRSKTEYVIEEVNGKKAPRKIGMAPIQREGMEYEFDVVGDIDDTKLAITKTRCSLLSGKMYVKPGEDLAKTLHGWLNSGEAAPATPAAVVDDPQVFGQQVDDAAVAAGLDVEWFDQQLRAKLASKGWQVVGDVPVSVRPALLKWVSGLKQEQSNGIVQ